MLLFYGLIALFLFLAAGSLNWSYAWLYIASMLSIQLVGLFFMPLDVIAERGSIKENTEAWDKLLTRLITPFFLGVYPVAGLDFRFHWSMELASGWHLSAVLIFFLGVGLVMWAMHTNRFFSTEVRIQFDRSHAVCSSGPYRWIRHPGYVGIILYYGVSPIILGSLWALIPAAVTVILLVIRTRLEDRTLQAKLPGYREYAAQVRYRLLPGIW